MNNTKTPEQLEKLRGERRAYYAKKRLDPEWYEKHKQRSREAMRIRNSRPEIKAKNSQTTKEWRKNNPDKIKQWDREKYLKYYSVEANRERRKAYAKRYYRANHALMLEKARLYRLAKKEQNDSTV